MKSCSAVLLAAGRGSRLGFDKILTPLAGRPVLEYALSVLRRSPLIMEVVIVTRVDLLEEVRRVAEGVGGEAPLRFVIGGAERQDSVAAGLGAVSPSAAAVLIHDAARPLLSERVIADTLAVAREHGAAVTAHRASDTLKTADESQRVTGTLDRSRIWAMGTPQVFERGLIVSAYAKVLAEGLTVTDDAAAVELLGRTVWLVENQGLNLKITRRADWELLELWLGREAAKKRGE